MAEPDLSWIEHEPFGKMASRLQLTVQRDTAFVTGEVAALVARRLIAAEVAPGGPYRDESGQVTERPNLAIADIFRRLGAPLTRVEAYLGSLPSAAARLAHGDAGLTRRSPSAARPVRTTLPQRQAEAVLRAYAPSLRSPGLQQYHSLLQVDRKGEISRIAELFGGSMALPPLCEYETLGAANLLVWLAYSVYDDFIDGEGDPQTLSPANAAHRDALRLFLQAAPAGLRSECYDTFQRMDEANAWELAHCRFAVTDGIVAIGTLPRYGQRAILAHRAGAHVLGPLIVGRLAGLADERLALLRSALSDYLIARQLNDDLHDWVDDMRQGHISPVVARLLHLAKLTGEQPLDDAIDTMRRVFWRTGLVDISRIALRHITRAESTLVGARIIGSDSQFATVILRPIQSSLERGLERHAADKQFVATYRLNAA